MRLVTRLIVLLIFIAFGTSPESMSQNLSPELLEASKKVHDAFDQNLKGWTRRSVEPILGSRDVIIDFWKSFDRQVKVSIVLFPSDPKAAQQYRESLRPGKKLEGLGYEAFVDGYCGKIVTFYRGRFAISISTEVELNLLSMNEKENSDLGCSEAAATSKLIACFVNLALNGDLAKDKRPTEDFLRRPCEQELMLKRLLGEEILNKYRVRY